MLCMRKRGAHRNGFWGEAGERWMESVGRRVSLGKEDTSFLGCYKERICGCRKYILFIVSAEKTVKYCNENWSQINKEFFLN